MTTPEVPEIFEIGSKEVGRSLTEFEAEKWGLEGSVDIGAMIERVERIGAIFGLDTDSQAKAMIQGANAVRGDLNETVKGLKLGK